LSHLFHEVNDAIEEAEWQQEHWALSRRLARPLQNRRRDPQSSMLLSSASYRLRSTLEICRM
jgi:hypothetical protein